MEQFLEKNAAREKRSQNSMSSGDAVIEIPQSVVNIKRDAFAQIDVVEKENNSMKRKMKWTSIIKYASMVVSLGLDFAPAFIPVLQNNWYSVPTVSFSLVILLLEIYLDQEGLELQVLSNSIYKNHIEKILQSLARKTRSRDFSDDYIKRIETQLSDVKLYRQL